MRGAAPEANVEDAAALARHLGGAVQGRLEHQHPPVPARHAHRQLARGFRAHLLVGHEQQRDRLRTGLAQHRAEHGHAHGDPGLHVEDAGSARPAGVEAPRHLGERTRGPDRVEVPEQQRAALAIRHGREQRRRPVAGRDAARPARPARGGDRGSSGRRPTRARRRRSGSPGARAPPGLRRCAAGPIRRPRAIGPTCATILAAPGGGMPFHDAFRRIPRGLARALVALALALSAAADDARPGIFRITPLRPVAELRAEALARARRPSPGRSARSSSSSSSPSTRRFASTSATRRATTSSRHPSTRRRAPSSSARRPRRWFGRTGRCASRAWAC